MTFLSVKQVAARYGLTEAWVYQCQDLKKIARKVGKYLRYAEADLIEMEERRSSSNRGFNLQHKHDVMRQIHTKAEKTTPKFKLKFDIVN